MCIGLCINFKFQFLPSLVTITTITYLAHRTDSGGLSLEKFSQLYSAGEADSTSYKTFFSNYSTPPNIGMNFFKLSFTI